MKKPRGEACRGISVEFRNVGFNYPEQSTEQGLKGLKGVNLVVPAGTTTAIVGHTGAGRLIILLLRKLLYYYLFIYLFLLLYKLIIIYYYSITDY